MTTLPIRILVTDDDALGLSAITRLLTSVGYEVFSAINGQQTLSMVDAHHPDMVLLDVVLPDMDGVEICRRIKADALNADIFVILLSGQRTSSVEQAQGMEDGADGYITRPIANRELLARIQSYLRIKVAEQKIREHAQYLEKVIEERKYAEDHILQLNRLYSTLSHINEVIVRAQNREVLFKEVCHIAIDFGKYKMAWIGMMDETEQVVKPLIFAGEENGYLANTQIKYSDEDLGRGPTGTSIREDRCVISHDIANDPLMKPWREQALQRGYRSSASVPIHQKGAVIGSFTVYAADLYAFNQEYEDLLKEIGKNISFALDSFEIEAKSRFAEEALLDSEMRFRQIAENIQEVFWVFDRGKHKHLYTNPSYETTFDVTKDALLKDPDYFIKKVLPEDLPEVLAALEKQKNGAHTETEYRIRHTDGSTHWLWDRSFPIYDESGNLVRTAGVATDITERKQAENIIQIRLRLIEYSAHHTLEDLLQKTMDEVCVLIDSPIGFYHFVEPDQKTLSLQAWSTRTLQEYCHTEGKGMHYSVDQAGVWVDCIHQRKTVVHNDYASLSYRKGLPEGHAELIREMVVPIMREGLIVAILGVGNKAQNYTDKDVSIAAYLADIIWEIVERKQADENMHQRVTELETLYESGLALSQLLSPKEIGQKIIELLEQKMDWHHTVIRLYNPINENLELLAFSQANLQDEEQQRESEKILNKHVIKSGQGLTGWAVKNSQIIRSDNVDNDPHYIETFPYIHSGIYVPIKSGQNTIGVISIESGKPNAFNEEDERLVATLANQAAVVIENARLYQTAQQEIIERKHIEELLADEKNQLKHRVEERTADLSRANSDLARALRSRDEFLASMSHELRTPLTGILGFSEALQLKTYGDLSEKQLKAIKIIEESGRHLLDLINDILDLSKIEAGKLDLQFAPYSLADICQASLQLTKGMAQQKKQTLQYSPATEQIIIQADVRRLKQILVNLLSNAIKFTPPEGELGLEVQADEIGGNIKLIVWDKGIGIKPEDMHKLFKSFTQIDGSLAREYSGTGLGLSLVNRLTELHNGGIEVQSIFGEGSRFIITLPWSHQNTSPVPYTPRLGTGRLPHSTVLLQNAPLVMIADDNETVLQIMADFLETQQYNLIQVRSGIELLERAAESQPNIMLVDIQMPGIDGLEAIRRIRAQKDPLLAATPIIAITALAMPGDRDVCLRAGANEYITKPVKLNDLAALIQKYTGKKYD